MRISPLDVRSQEFKKSMRGYDPEEVKAFLDAIADTMEDLLKEKETAQSELVALRKKVETFTEMEISLRDAMVAAQKAGDEAKMNARRNAELMIREADLEVRQRIADAKRKVDDIFKARETVRAEMRAFLPRLRSLLESQLTYLENIEQEVTSMDLGDGNTAEAREVRSFTQTVEATATEAETEAREETVRQEEHAVERREQVAGGHATGQETQGVPAGRHEGTDRRQHDPLDDAMHEHHQRQRQDPPAGQDVRGEGAQGQPAHDGWTHAEQAHGGQAQTDQPHGDQPQGEQPHHEPAHGEHRPEGQQRTAEQGAPRADAGVSPWAPDPSSAGPESDKELRISHTPQEESESQEREDVSA